MAQVSSIVKFHSPCAVWGGNLLRRFCFMFSESSPCLLGQHGSILENFQKIIYKTFGTSCRPRLYYICPFLSLSPVNREGAVWVRRKSKEGGRWRERRRVYLLLSTNKYALTQACFPTGKFPDSKCSTRTGE